MVPLGKRCDFSLPASIGGFGLASKVAVDLFPNLQIKVGKRASLAAGWRFLYMNYESGYEDGAPRSEWGIVPLRRHHDRTGGRIRCFASSLLYSTVTSSSLLSYPSGLNG